MPWILQGGHDLTPTSHSYVLVKHWSSFELLLLPWKLICLESLLPRTRHCQQWAPKAIQVRAGPLGIPAAAPKPSLLRGRAFCGAEMIIQTPSLCCFPWEGAKRCLLSPRANREVSPFQVSVIVLKFGLLIVASVQIVGIFWVISQMFNLLNRRWWALTMCSGTSQEQARFCCCL